MPDFIFPPKTYGQDNIRRILSSVRKRNSAVIVGLPGIGKSTIARLLADPRHRVWQDCLAETGLEYHFIHLDYSFNPGFQEVFRHINWELAKQGLSLQPDDDSFAILDAWLTYDCQPNQYFVFIFDSYDDVDDAQARPLLNRLRRLRNRQMNMSFLFVSRREPDNLYEVGELVDAVHYLSPLSEQDQYLTIARHEHRLGRPFKSQQKEWLLKYCGGWPGFMKYMSDLIFDGKIPDEGQAVSTCLADRRIKQICQDVWAELSEAEKEGLAEIAANRDPGNEDLARQLQCKYLLNQQRQIQSPIFSEFVRSLPQTHSSFCAWQIKAPYLLVSVQGQTYHLELTLKEIQLLTLLMAQPGEVVSLPKIQQQVWPENPHNPDRATDYPSMTKFIGRTRLKIDDALHGQGFLSGQESCIETVRKQGYRLNPQIRVKAGPA